MYNQITNSSHTVGVHVRRGDMSTSNAYWETVPAQYFINVCTCNELRDYTFFFFSEEPDWIENEIIPHINVKYKISDTNSAFYGYKDLYLLSCCQYQITSQGSFGKIAFMINKHTGKKYFYYNPTNPDLYSISNKL